MVLSAIDRRLLAALKDGLPLTPEPYAAVGAPLGLSAEEVAARLRALRDQGTLTRFGVVVRHHELGYRANAMTVWDVPDARVRDAGQRLAAIDFVTLCYRRPRRSPRWPYNLFAMIHGRERARVETLVAQATWLAGLEGCPRAILFSRRRFKQRGADYGAGETPDQAPDTEVRDDG